MTFENFAQLPFGDQLQHAFLEGTFLARGWQEHDVVHLYHLRGPGTGFFVELYYSSAVDAIVQVCGFRSAGLLEEYVAGIELPAGWA